MFAALGAHQVDAVLLDTVAVLAQAKQSDGQLEVVGQYRTGGVYGALVPKNSANLAIVNKLIGNMKRDRTLDQLATKYLVRSRPEPQHRPVPAALTLDERRHPAARDVECACAARPAISGRSRVLLLCAVLPPFGWLTILQYGKARRSAEPVTPMPPGAPEPRPGMAWYAVAVAIVVLVLGLVVATLLSNDQAVIRTFFDGRVLRDSLPSVLTGFWLNVRMFLIAEALVLPWASSLRLSACCRAARRARSVPSRSSMSTCSEVSGSHRHLPDRLRSAHRRIARARRPVQLRAVHPRAGARLRSVRV